MGYFPFFVDIENSRWLIVGGGAVALRKAGELLPFGVRIRVVSPEISGAFYKLKKNNRGERLSLEEREFEEGDVLKAQYVIAATSCRELNSRISALCREKGIPVNVADKKGECSFLFPSVIQDGPVTVGITTGGTSPALARLLKARLAQSMPEGLGPLAEQLGSARSKVKEAFPHSPEVRSAISGQLAEAGFDNGCRLDGKIIGEIIDRKLEEEHE